MFCSYSPNAVDPGGDGRLEVTRDCESYMFVGKAEGEWHPMPDSIRAPHPFGTSVKVASAFKVRNIVYPIAFETLPAVEWFARRRGPWHSERVPSRGEYLIRPGGKTPMRKVVAVLDLEPPYLAVVSADPVASAGGVSGPRCIN